MTTDNKTLADVKPGGMVRLGDQVERARFEAWAEPRKHTLTRWGDSPGDVKPLFVSEVPGNYISPAAQAAWEAWQHLSAQPSPGGQDALDCIGRIEEAIEFRVPHDIYAAVHGELAELKAALAARQPVGQEPAFFVNRWEMEHGTASGLVAMRTGKHLGIRDFFTVPLYAAPPAQAVDLEELRRAVCVVGVVGQIDGHDVVRRNSVLDVIDTRRQRLADSQTVGE